MNVNGSRIVRDLLNLGHIGYEEQKGTSRMAYTAAFCEGRDYVQKLMEEAGMETYVDPVGNLVGRLEGNDKKIISIGSHIDTVPEGGMYDGTLGVIAGIEVIRSLKENGYQNHHTIEIIAFNEEEGNIVGGTFGSKAFTGQPQEEDALNKIGFFDMSEEGIRKTERNPDDYKCYLELHIEQGGILEQKKIPVGVVEGIFGIVRYHITVHGKANHAGSTPMYLRDDALVKASRMIGRLVEIAGEQDPTMTCTIGKLDIEPGAVNVIPGEVRFCLELRSMNTQAISGTVEQFRKEFAHENVEVKNFLWQDPTRMNDTLKEVFRTCCREKEIEFIDIPSGAGHDSINMALFTPTGMLFVPSIGGISHSILEYSTPEDIELGTSILLEALLKIDSEEVKI